MNGVVPTASSKQARAKARITGIDASRGIALIGMLAIHVMPAHDENYEPTALWLIASGTSAALFAFLAGVGLAIGSSLGTRANAQRLRAARASLAVRAAAIAGIGLLLGQVETPASIILAYYGVMFALAIPLLGLSARALAACAVGLATLGAVVAQLLARSLTGLGEQDPSLSLLVSDPGGSLSALLFTGAYPAIPWMAYLCAGLAIGKLDLRSFDIQLRIFLTGLFLAVGTALTSALFLGPLGVKEILVETSSRWLSAEEVNDVLIWGPLEGAPLSTGWWQVALSPYSHTAFETLNTLGVALAVFGAMLFIGNKIQWAMAPLCVLGSMTLTLYSVHLLFLATGIWEERPNLSLWVQLGACLLFAMLWRNISGRQRGPLEHVVALLSDRARDRVRGSVRESP